MKKKMLFTNSTDMLIKTQCWIKNNTKLVDTVAYIRREATKLIDNARGQDSWAEDYFFAI